MQFLRHQPDQRARRAVIGDDVVAVDGNLAFARHEDAADDADERGLAGAIGAEQREDFAATDIEIDAVESLETRTRSLRKVCDGNNRLHGGAT